MTPTPAQLAAWRALADAATPAPWEPKTWFGDPGGWTAVGPHHLPRQLPPDDDYAEYEDDEPDGPVQRRAEVDAAFVAAARQAVPALLDAVETLTRERDALRLDYGGMRKRLDEAHNEIAALRAASWQP